MNTKKLIATAIIAMLPISGFAELVINNKTKSYGTAKTNMSPCSSIAGSKGILNPDSSLTIPQAIFDLYCPKKCEVWVYMNKSCSGSKIATVTVDSKTGVSSVNNHQKVFTVSGSGKEVNIMGGK
ncbi:MAG: hypothetical protein H0W64_02380 [Gammaproteobacteria bacterium]|nr:hypothetical protein [Gammaproteobacteria bacterium]